MVSQANFFRDDISGKLYPTPAEAIASERENRQLLHLFDFLWRSEECHQF
jgi:hypothetical protein